MKNSNVLKHESASTADRASVLQAETRLIEAIKAGDIGTLDALLHDDLLFITPDGQTITKESDLAAHRAGAMVVDRLAAEVEQIRLLGDVAIVTLVLDTAGRMMGQSIQGRFRYIRCWKLTGGQWKVIGGSCTQLK